jgi:hypothetical protein
MRDIAAAGAAVGLAAALVGTAVAASALSLLGVGGATSPTATPGVGGPISPAMLVLYQAAAVTCPGLPWTVLAAIGTRRVGERAVDPVRGARRGQPGRRGGADAVRVGDLLNNAYGV